MKKLFGVLCGIILAVSGLLLTACGDPYKDMKIVADATNIQMSVGEERQLTISVENAPNGVSTYVNLSPDSEFVSVIDSEVLSGGKTCFTIKALTVGEGSIAVKSLEGNKSLTIYVKVDENIQSFSRNSNNAFVVRENGFQLDLTPKNLFNFVPSNTTQTDLQYFYTVNNTDYQVQKIVAENVDEEEQTILRVRIYTMSNEIFNVLDNNFTLKAVSAYNSSIEQTFVVDIIEDIEVNGLYMVERGGLVIHNPVLITPIGENVPEGALETIELVSNDSSRANVVLEMELNLNVSNISVTANTNFSVVEITKKEYTTITFNVQTVYVGTDTLTITLKYEDYNGYEVTKQYSILIVSAPNSVIFNELETGETINLFDVNYNVSIASVNLTPIVYSLDSSFTQILIDFCDSNGEKIENWSDYVTLTYKNITREPNEEGYIIISNADFENNVLISPITLLGKNVYDGENGIYIRVEVVSPYILAGDENRVQNEYKIEIKPGAKDFKVNYPTAENVLYLDINDSNGITKTFSDFTITEGAYWGVFTYRYSNASYFTVEQVLDADKPEIKITPLAVGSGGKVTIYLPNGCFTELFVNVEASALPSESNFGVEMNDNIVKFVEDKETKTYDLTIMEKRDRAETLFKFLVSPQTATLYSGSITYDYNAEEIDTLDCEYSNFSNTLSISPYLKQNVYISSFSIELTMTFGSVIDFKKIDIDDEKTIVYTINVTCYIPIQSLSFKQEVSSGVFQQANNIPIYNLDTSSNNGVGYYYGIEKNYSKVMLYPFATLFSGEIISAGKLREYIFDLDLDASYFYKTSLISGNLKVSDNVEVSGDETYYDGNTLIFFGSYLINIDDLSLRIICNDGDISSTTNSCWFSFNLNLLGVDYNCVVTLKVQNYTRLSSIGLYDYQSTIYLDDRNQSYKSGYFLNPIESDCTEFDLKFIPDDTTNINIINYSKTDSEITINYNSAYGAGSGRLYFIPKDWYTTKEVNNDDIKESGLQYVTIIASDGTEDNPIYINSVDDFIEIASNSQSLTKHYAVSTTLDFNGVNLTTFGVLRGSIKGIGDTAGFVNLNIKTPTTIGDTSYLGLFAYIEEGAYIENLTITGKLGYNLSTNSNAISAKYVGLVCGQNKGTLKNLSVTLLNDYTNKNEGVNVNLDENVFVGVLAGASSGNIINDNSKNLISIKDEFYVKNSFSASDEFGTYVGGVVGYNNGNINLLKNENEEINVTGEKDFTLIGNISGQDVKTIGGVTGVNVGMIDGAKVSGNVKIIVSANSLSENAGGITGLNAFSVNNENLKGTIQNCLIRTFVTAGNYVGAVAGKNTYTIGSGQSAEQISGIITGNIVQLCYNGNLTSMLSAVSGNYANTFAGDDVDDTILKPLNNAYYYQEFSNNQGPISYLDNYNLLYKQGSFVYQEDSIVIDTEKSKLLDGVDVVSYLEYYEAKNSSLQTLISKLNVQDFPIIFKNPENVTLSSGNSKILTFDEQGKVKLWGTGLVEITATSLLNSEIKKNVYVYVINKTDNFKVKIYNDTYLSNQGSYIGIKLDDSVELTLEYTANDITKINEELITDSYGNPISVELVKNEEFTANIQLDINGNNQASIIPSLVGQTLLLKADEDTNDLINLSITPKFSFVVNENSYEMDFNFLNSQFDAFIKIEKGTTEMLMNTTELYVEPNDEFTLNIDKWVTDNKENDTVEISFAKITETGTNNYFNIISSTLSKNEAESSKFIYHYDENKNPSFTFKFNSNDFKDYEGTYYINFTAANGYRQTVIVYVLKQSITNITTKNYYDIDIADFDFSTEPVLDVSPDGDNLLEILVYPEIAEFDYIEIVNDSQNYTNENEAIFSLVELQTSNDNIIKVVDIFGAINIDGGLRIPKEYVNDSGKIYLKYNISSVAKDGSISKFNITAYKDGNIQKTSSVSVDVRIKDGVYVSIIGKESVNSNERIYVARGLTYNLKVDIVGFTENEVYFDSTNTQYASIVKSGNNFVLNINSNINYTQGNGIGYEVDIDCYGEKSIDGKIYTSGVRTLKLIIVDYVILKDNILDYSYEENNQNSNIIIKDSQNEVVNVAIGNKYDLSINFINGSTIEYNAQDSSIVQKVKVLEETLAKNGTWYITDKTSMQTQKLSSNNLPSNMYYRVEYNSQSGYFGIVPLYINYANNTNYYLSFKVNYTYINGVVQVIEEQQTEDTENFNTDFLIEAYQSGNEENEIPISNYKELMSMQSGGYYILVDDIELEEDFAPISTAIAGLNGNGHTITFRANWSVNGLQYSGLFETIQENALIRNLKLSFNSTANTNFTITNTNEISYFGFLAGRNLGVITNCEIVENRNNTYVSMNPNTNSTTYVAGLVGLNEGYITNSRVVINLVVRRSNLAGLVAVNEGSIASSYVKDSNLTNESTISSTNKTAGFVVENGITLNQDVTIGGLDVPQILTSYVSGTCSTNIYADEINKIWSNVEVSGFVYNNLGAISDCYSNVPINSQSIRAGFAFNNSGLIQNSYSTSTYLSQNSQTDYGFVYNNSYSTQAGKLLNCKYLLGNVNNGIFVSNIQGLDALTELDFSNQNYFTTFAMSDETEKTKGVWFYPSVNGEVDFKYNGVSQKFTYGRPELVAPNIIVDTTQVLESSSQDSSTGEEIYHYSGGEAQGSKYNPYIITSAEKFESLILETNVNNRNSKYYRFVKNIDYASEGILSSSLYNTTFIGDIEGNGMTISGLVIDTRDNLNYGGLFAKVGEGLSYIGSVKNLNISPKYINMPNTSSVGTVAGALESGLLFNVKVNGFEYDSSGIVIVGKNIVGGVVGIAKNTYKLYNVESSVSASATYRSINYGSSFKFYSSYSGSITGVSYAGVVAGILEGEGRVRYVSVNESSRALGEVAGLYFGRIGTNSNVANLEINLTNNQFVNAAYYGGILAGEIAGVVNNVTIQGSTTNFFRYVPSVPSGVGGVAGYMSNGTIQNVNVNVDLIFPNIEVVGGIVGEMIGGQISNTHKTGDITSMTIAGGIVGYMNEGISNDSAVNKKDIVIENSTVTNGRILVTNDNLLTAYVGGIVGVNEYQYLEGTTYHERQIINCYVEADLEVNSTMYGGFMTTAVGGIVGASYIDKTRTPNSISGIAIYNNDFKSNYMPDSSISENYVMPDGSEAYFSSNCTYSVTIKNYRDAGQIAVYYGGIVGLGYAYQENIIDNKPVVNSDIYYYFSNESNRTLTGSGSSILSIDIWAGTNNTNEENKNNNFNDNLKKIENS